METSLIKTSLNNNVPKAFNHNNGFLEIVDIEMIALQAVTYTSLRDLIPSSPPSSASPTHNSSWHEIPIKNPLVKHAALAYLQPMSTPPDVSGKGIFRSIRDKCGCGDGIGCLDWLRDVVWKKVREAFGGERRRYWEEEDDDDDDDDEDYVKVTETVRDSGAYLGSSGLTDR